MPDPRIVPLTEYDERRRMDSCTRGFSDLFGDRLQTFDRRTATRLELLRFRDELNASASFEAALRDRIEETRVQDPAIVPVRSVERWDGALTLISHHGSGRRLSETLAEHRGPAFAMDFLRQVVPAMAALAEGSRRFAHGALTLERVVVRHDRRLAVIEYPLGVALESIGWPPVRLRAELGLVVPEPFASKPFDARIDAIQIGFAALALLLGRRLDATDYPARVVGLLDEAADADGGETWAASRLRSWLERALQVGPRPFESAQDALASLADLPSPTPVEVPRPRVPWVPAAEPSPIHPADAPAARSSPPPERTAPPAAPVASVARDQTPPSAAPAKPTKPKRRLSVRSLALVAVSAVAIAEGVVLAGQWYFRPAPPVAEPALPQVPPPAAIDVLPPADAPTAPAEPPVVTPPAPEIVRRDTPPATPAPAPPPDRPAAVNAAAGPRVGGVTFVSPVDLQVFEGGKRIGSSGAPIAALEGVHTVELVNDAVGFRGRETVTVKSGELTSRTIAMPSGRISINAVPWADVWIDGAAAGQTPLANLAIPIGEHQITFRHPQFGEQRQTTVVTAAGITRVSATMQR